MTLVFVRWVIVCVVLIAIFHERILREREALLLARRRILLMAGFGFTGFTVLFYIAGYYTTAVNMTLLQTAIPVLVLAGAALFRGVRITWMQVIGMSVALLGILLIATHGELTRIRELEFNRGDLMILVASVFYAGYTLGASRPTANPGAGFLRRSGHRRAYQFVSLLPDRDRDRAFPRAERQGLGDSGLCCDRSVTRGTASLHARRRAHRPGQGRALQQSDADLRGAVRGAHSWRGIPCVPCGSPWCSRCPASGSPSSGALQRVDAVGRNS